MEQRLTNLHLGILEIECAIDIGDPLPECSSSISDNLTVKDYRICISLIVASYCYLFIFCQILDRVEIDFKNEEIFERAALFAIQS